MSNITNKFKNKYYTYNPAEFMPVYRDGELSNKAAFHAYKIRSAVINTVDSIQRFHRYMCDDGR